jgi:phospholipase/carboxylesterase
MVRALGENGFSSERIVIAGFSQGACLSSEFVASHPARYAGLIAFTGGLIGAPGAISFEPSTALQGMPALLLSGDPDPHVPWARVEETAAVLTAMGAKVTARRYPGRPHTISNEEVELAREFLVNASATR